MHIGLLGIVSIFTGIISPVVHNSIASFPFPLTDLQIPAYIILVFLAIICILLAVRSWSWVRFFGLLVLILIGYLFTMSWNGTVESLSGIPAGSLSWGWIFLAIGSGMIINCMFSTENEESITTLWDHLIGWLSAVTILALTGLIISISYIPRTEKWNNKNILNTVLWTGSTESISGVILTKPYPSISNLILDRSNDSLSFYTSSGNNMISQPKGWIYNRLPYATVIVWNRAYTITADGLVVSNTGITIGTAILPQSIEWSIVMQSSGTISVLQDTGIQTYSGVYSNINSIVGTKNGKHIAWSSKAASGYTLYKDGLAISKDVNSITQIALSPDGTSIMALILEPNGEKYIFKNGNKIEKIWGWYMEGSLRMNGNDGIYAIEHEWVIELIHNGKLLDRKFDEIREIFIENESANFVYFGRPLGEKTYCLYTRYKGNLCGLSGYMNPRLSPDWTSIIYAGLKDGVWWIYRNATPIIRNTGYPNRDNISQDYVFFDITNPNYYLFIRHMDNWYQLYTKWGWVYGTWKDIWLDVSFGYDNKIIMSVQDEKGWRIIEF